MEDAVDLAVEHLEALKAFLAPADGVARTPAVPELNASQAGLPRLRYRKPADTDISSGGEAV